MKPVIDALEIIYKYGTIEQIQQFEKDALENLFKDLDEPFIKALNQIKGE